MGNICASKHQKQQTAQTIDHLNRNFVVYTFLVKNFAVIDITMGTYHCHKSETLLAIVQKQYLDYCTEMRDYADDFEHITNCVVSQTQRSLSSGQKQGASKLKSSPEKNLGLSLGLKSIITVPINKQCPYNKLQICLLPTYSSIEPDCELYLKQFEQMSRQILAFSSDITIQLNHTSEGANGIPNQTLMAIFLKSFAEQAQNLLDEQERSTEGKKYSNTNTTNSSVYINSSTSLSPNINKNSSKAESIKANKKKNKLKLTVIGNDTKLINLVRYEIIKLQNSQLVKGQI